MENDKQYQDAVAKQVQEYIFREYQTNHYWELGTENVRKTAEVLKTVLADLKVQLIFGTGQYANCTDRERREFAQQVILLEALILFLQDLHQRKIECDTERQLGV